MLHALAFMLSLLAQPPAVAPTPAPGVDPDDLEKALAADARSAAEATAAATTTPVTPPPSAGGYHPNPDMAVILDAAAAAFSEDEPRQAGAHDPAKNGLSLQQLEISLGKAVDPYFRFDAFLVFSQFGVEVEEAYATSLALPFNLQLRAGQFLTRFGRQNATHPHNWAFLDQPFMWSRVFGGEGNRAPGLELSVLLPLPWFVELVASLGDAAGEATARSFWGAEDLGVHSPLDLQSTLALKQFFAPSDDLSLLWGLSAALGPNPSGYHNRTEVFGTDLFVKLRPITVESGRETTLQVEALARRRQVPAGVLTDAGGYAQLVFRWARRYAVAGRYEYGTPVWNDDGQVGDDYLDPLWLGHRHRASLALTFTPTEFSRLRLQPSMDVTTRDDQPTWAVLLGFEVAIGAHGAHPF
jgi:hypothetical protein